MPFRFELPLSKQAVSLAGLATTFHLATALKFAAVVVVFFTSMLATSPASFAGRDTLPAQVRGSPCESHFYKKSQILLAKTLELYRERLSAFSTEKSRFSDKFEKILNGQFFAFNRARQCALEKLLNYTLEQAQDSQKNPDEVLEQIITAYLEAREAPLQYRVGSMGETQIVNLSFEQGMLSDIFPRQVSRLGESYWMGGIYDSPSTLRKILDILSE